MNDMSHHDYATRVAADVAARYGAKVDPAVVQTLPMGHSSHPLPVWNGHALVYPDPEVAGWRKAIKTRAKRDLENPMIAARRKRVAALHAEGHCDRVISEMLDISLNKVRDDRYRLKLASHADPQAAAQITDKRNQIRAFAAMGYEPAAIAAEVGLTADHVRRVARGMGVQFSDTRKLALRDRTNNVRRLPDPNRIENPSRYDLAAARRAKLRALIDDLGRPLVHDDMRGFYAVLGVDTRCLRKDMIALGLPWPRANAYIARFAAPECQKAKADVRQVVAARDAKLDQLRGMDTASKTTAQIAAELGVSVRTARAYLRSLGLTSLSQAESGASVGQRERIRAARAKVEELGATGRYCLTELAAEVGMSRDTVSRYVDELGLKLPRKKANGWENRAKGMTARVMALREQLKAMRAANQSYRQMAAATGKSIATVQAHLYAMGLTVRSNDRVAA